MATAILQDDQQQTRAPARRGFDLRRHRGAAVPLLVLAAAAGLAVSLWVQFEPHARELWHDPIHDRNTHLWQGVIVTSDLQHGRFLQVLLDLDKARTWPPLHDAGLVPLALMLGGSEQWAVLPSLLAWIGTAVFAFLLARRCVPAWGDIAGLVAAVLVLCSPAQRAFATDVMLESLGACLTVAALYCYVGVRQTGGAAFCRGLGAALTALLLVKYNYWFLTALAVVAAEFCAWPRYYVGVARATLQRLPWRSWLLAQAKYPLTWVLLAVLGLIAAVRAGLAGDFMLFGRQVSLRAATNLTTLAYWLLMLRLAPWWWRAGRAWLGGQALPLRSLVQWHVLPVLVWFLWPQKLSSFLWVLFPISNAGEHPRTDLWGGYPFYLANAADDYHVAAWSAAVVAGLFVLALAAWALGRLKPGAAAVVLLVLMAGVLAAHHPNRKSRFLHSWIPAAWVGAGIGAACLVGRRPVAVATIAGLAIAVGVAGHASHLLDAPHAPEGGPGTSTGRASLLDISDWYLPHLADSEHVAIFSNVPMQSFSQWTYVRRFGRAVRPETDVKGMDRARADADAHFAKWLQTTKADIIVMLYFPPGSPGYVAAPGFEGLEIYRDLLQRQSIFLPSQMSSFVAQGCEATIWKRAGVAHTR